MLLVAFFAATILVLVVCERVVWWAERRPRYSRARKALRALERIVDGPR